MSEAARPAWAASEGLDFGERGGAASAGDHTNSTVHVYATNGVSGQAEVHFLFLRPAQCSTIPRDIPSSARSAGRVVSFFRGSRRRGTRHPEIGEPRRDRGWLRQLAMTAEATSARHRKGRTKPGAAGRTNSTVWLYATNGVSRQAKVRFLFTLPVMPPSNFQAWLEPGPGPCFSPRTGAHGGHGEAACHTEERYQTVVQGRR